MRRNKLGKLGRLALAGVFSAYGCGVDNIVNNQCEREIPETVQQDLDARIQEADFDYLNSGGHDVEGYISLLGDFQGECAELRDICKKVRGRNFSYRWASAENPTIRREICADYREYLN